MKKQTKKHILEALIPITIIGGIALSLLYFNQEPVSEKFEQLEIYSKNELDFLKSEGFLTASVMEKIYQSQNKNEIISFLKPSNLIEQNLNTPDESFEVLATKLDLEQGSYQLAFKLENKSNEKKEFYLIPVSDENQTVFQEIKGQISEPTEARPLSADRGRASDAPLTELYDVEKHRAELKPELAQAYSDIETNGYQAKPVKITLEPNSKLIAQSKWQISQLPETRSRAASRERVSGEASHFKPVYFLIYGSAGGAKDDLIILNVFSHPQAGDYWTVSFQTRGTDDLYIIPDDQQTIDDLEFVSLECDGEERTPIIDSSSPLAPQNDKEEVIRSPQANEEGVILSPQANEEGVIRSPQANEEEVILSPQAKNLNIYYPNWHCPGTAKLTHLVKVARKHTLKFIFGDETKYAYNSPGGENWLSGYTTRRKLTIDADLIDADLTNLPVLVKLTSSNFDFSKDNDDGFDIRFTQSDGSTLLKYERERHSDPNAEYWVKIPSVSSSADTDFYMYYRTTDTADGADPTNVWDANYVMVQHMDDDPDTSHIDDSTTNYDGTKGSSNNPAEIAGKIFNGQDFSSDTIALSSEVNLSTVHTLSSWFEADTFAGPAFGGDTSLEYGNYCTSTTFAYRHSGGVSVSVSHTLSTGVWYHLVTTRSGATVKFYVDGTQLGSDQTIASPTFVLGVTTLGNVSAIYSNGTWDELRLCDDVRTAAEIKADYNSGNDSLLTYGSEEVKPKMEIKGSTLRIKGGSEWTVDGMTYTTRRKLTIDHDLIDADLTDFPVLVKLTSSNFDFSKANSDGFDIRFTDSGGSTLLSYERERHDQANSLAEYWVKIPAVSGTVDTDFYIYYRTTDTADGADPTNVWDANFKGVWHLHQGDSTDAEFYKDSTTNVEHGTLTDADGDTNQADGKVGKAMDLDGDADYIDASNLSINAAYPLTVSLWFYPHTSGVFRGILRYANLALLIDQTAANKVTIFVPDTYYTTVNSFNVNAWNYFAVARSNTGPGDYFLNGIDEGDVTKTISWSGAGTWWMGKETYADSDYFDGLIDEVRITNDLRTAAEIKADYNSEADTLLTYGGEEQGYGSVLRIK